MVGKAEPAGAGAQCHIAGGQDVRVPEDAHGDVVGGPLADAPDGDEPVVLGHRVVGIVQVEVAGGQLFADGDDVVGPRAWADQHLPAALCDPCGGGEEGGQAFGASDEGRAEGCGEPRQLRPGGRDRDLLAHQSPQQHLVGVHRAGEPDAGGGGDSSSKGGLASDGLVDADRVGVQVEQPANPPDQ